MFDVRMRGFSELTSIEKALRAFLTRTSVKALDSEWLRTQEILRRVLAEDVVCPRDSPPFDRSAVDGYALRAEDTYGASHTNPMLIDVMGISRIGTKPAMIVSQQQAVSIATGAPIPEGANAVIMIEFTESMGANKIEVYRAVTPGENVSKQGEDVRKGDKILTTGTLLQPHDIGILAAISIERVKVTRKPRVAVLSTGNELVQFGEEPPEGKIIDSNRPTILAMVIDAGGEPIDLGISPDNGDEITSRLRLGLEKGDIVIVTGGTSVGERDLLPSIVNSLGNPGIIVHGVAIRPGRPVALAVVDGKPVVLLPGFPVAAIITFDVFVMPVINRMLGLDFHLPQPSVWAKAVRRVPSTLGSRTFARVIVSRSDLGYTFEPLRTSGSGIISSIVRANGIVAIPENKEGIEEGEVVEVKLIRPVGSGN